MNFKIWFENIEHENHIPLEMIDKETNHSFIEFLAMIDEDILKEFGKNLLNKMAQLEKEHPMRSDFIVNALNNYAAKNYSDAIDWATEAIAVLVCRFNYDKRIAYYQELVRKYKTYLTTLQKTKTDISFPEQGLFKKNIEDYTAQDIGVLLDALNDHETNLLIPDPYDPKKVTLNLAYHNFPGLKFVSGYSNNDLAQEIFDSIDKAHILPSLGAESHYSETAGRQFR